MNKNLKNFDVVLFHKELDFLTMRLKEYQNVVEKFIIVPMTEDAKLEGESMIGFTDRIRYEVRKMYGKELTWVEE